MVYYSKGFILKLQIQNYMNKSKIKKSTLILNHLTVD